MKSPQLTATSCSLRSWNTGWIAPDISIVWVPTSKNCTMCGGFFWRYAAMAAVSTSG